MVPAAGGALATKQARQFDLSPQTFEQALTFCDYLAESDLVPKDFKGKPANCLIAIQWGAELGLKPLQALQNLAIINGRPALWGDAVIALVRGSGLCEYVVETDEGDTAYCKVKRRGEPERVRTFSMKDAEAAGLKGKTGPWMQYPKRMRQMRARAFALRDVFPDVLRGLSVAEEVMDIPAASQQQEPPPPALEVVRQVYPAEKFTANLADWHKAIAAGKATADNIIAKVESLGSLTEEQKKQIRTLPAAPEAAPPAAAEQAE
ncbi:MAG: hypothetical protein IIZ92_03325 [Aquincola sp.]|nr:hypothetical protein [Aquincola sp.]